MPVTITIHGDNAAEALKELQTFANGEAKQYAPNTVVGKGNIGAGVIMQGTVPKMYDEAMKAEALAEEPEVDRIESVTLSETELENYDSAGVPFDPELHTGTKKKDGTWRAKKGKADEAAALVEEVAEAEDETAANSSISLAELAAQTENTPDAPSDEIDEFVAFKEAAAQAEEPVSVPDRTWTDADLGQLCSDAAVKLGNPAPIKALIAKYVPEGEVPHSRNIPNTQREVFAQEIEATAGIEYAG